MSNIYYWEKLTFSKLRFSRKENLKKYTNFEEQKRTRYIRGNVYFGIIVFSCLSSTKPCLRFLLICFALEIEGFYQSSLGNEFDFKDIMIFSQISWLKLKFQKLETRFCKWEQWLQRHYDLPVSKKLLYLFACKRKDLKKDF